MNIPSKIIRQIIDKNDNNKISYVIEENIWKIIDNNNTEPNHIIDNNILPLTYYISQEQLHHEHHNKIGVILNPDDDVNLLKPFLANLPIIVLKFDTFRDGRAYSQAYLLKTRFGYDGIILATGDVLRDQLAYMARCGFNAFAVRQDKDIEDAIKGFSDFSQNYQADVLVDKAYYNRV
jgi:uncharacterized protein (DUF934 family)